MMKRNDRIKLDAISLIDEAIVEKNANIRYAAIKKNMARRRAAIIAIAATLALLIATSAFLILPMTSVRAPIYKGMTASTSPTLPASSDIKPSFAAGSVTGDLNQYDVVNQDNPFSTGETIKTALESYIPKGDASEETTYYAYAWQELYITVHLENPDECEIISFILNGVKYTSYMFEYGSDLENIIVKVNIGSETGMQEFKIDAIKYIDNESIFNEKNAKMAGDDTIRVMVLDEATDLSKSCITDTDVSHNSFSFTFRPTLALTGVQQGQFYALLYDGNTIVAQQEASFETTEIVFDGLSPQTIYQIAIAAYLDSHNETKPKLAVLESYAFRTDAIVLFNKVSVDTDCIYFDLIWDNAVQDRTITSISLYTGGDLVKELPTDANMVDGLLSGKTYKLLLTYLYEGKDNTIDIQFTTEKKSAPTVEFPSLTSTQTSLSAKLYIYDVHKTCQSVAVELYQGSELIATSTSTDELTFENLLSGTEYSIRVTVTYHLNDGHSTHTKVTVKKITTQAKETPTAFFNQLIVTDTKIAGGSGRYDPDNVGKIEKVSLLYNGEEIGTSNSATYTFENLFPDTKYTLALTLTYDSNDGKGSVTETVTQSVTTKPSQDYSLTVTELTPTLNSISLRLVETDPKDLLAITKVALLLEETEIAVSEAVDSITFEGLSADTRYTVIIHYTVTIGTKTQALTKTQFAKTRSFEDLFVDGRYTDSQGIVYELEEGLHGIGATVISAPSTIRAVVWPDLGYDIVQIETNAFANALLTSIEIPSTVQEIRDNAFANCALLSSVILHEGLEIISMQAFTGCSSLTEISIPSSVTILSPSTFEGCSKLATVTLPDTLTYIEAYAFANCSALTTVRIPDSVKSISYGAFSFCTSLESVTVPQGITVIEEYTFQGCTALKTVSLPYSLTMIDLAAFEGCTALTSITLPDSITVLGSYAFQNCNALTDVTLSSNLVRIGERAFEYIRQNASIVIPESVVLIEEVAFNTSVTLFCEASEKPSTWHENCFDSHQVTVYYQNEWQYVNGVPTPLDT